MAQKCKWFCLAVAFELILFISGGALCQHVRIGGSSAKFTLAPSNVSCSSWIVDITTQRLSSYNDPQLKIKPVVKAKVSYGSVRHLYETSYEELWYGTDEQGCCLGARRYGPLAIQPRDYVAIRLVSDPDASPAQLSASADAIARLLLDTQLNDDWIEAVIVPDDLFDAIKEYLCFYNINAIENGQYATDTGASFAFVLKSKSGHQVANLVYRS